MLKQIDQDKIWEYFQNTSRTHFDLSETRLQFLARRCAAKEKVLNIGVGSGTGEKLLLDRGVNCYSMDPSPEAISRLKNELSFNSDNAKVGIVNKIPFNAGIFDKVIISEVLEHLSIQDFNSALKEICRVLKPGGILLGTVPYRENLRDGEVFCPSCSFVFHRWGHNLSFDKVSLKNYLFAHEFKIVKIYPRTFPDYRWRGLRAFLRAILRGALGRLGEAVVCPNLYFYARSPG